jgi:hypothetical protein
MADKQDTCSPTARKVTNVQFVVNPLQTVLDRIESQRSSTYAKALNFDVTQVFFDTLRYKVKMKENISLEVTGTTRSGKTSVASSIMLFVSKLRNIPFTTKNIRQDQFDFLNYIKDQSNDSLFRTQWVVDETRHGIFQEGSMAQHAVLKDFNNICAVLELAIAWLNPQNYDTSHNSQYVLYVWGKDVPNKLTKCLLYDISSHDMFAGTPLGYVIVDVSQFVGTDLEKEYLKLKWDRVEKQKEQSQTNTMQYRKRVAEAFEKSKEWKRLTNRKQKKIFIKSVLGDMIPNDVVDEIVEMTEMTQLMTNPEEFKKKYFANLHTPESDEA